MNVVFILLLIFSKQALCDHADARDEYDDDYESGVLSPEPRTTPTPMPIPDEDDDSALINNDDRKAIKNEIHGSFSNKKSFACPRAKPGLHTGENVAQISPEDISIVAAMGDSLASGKGLWAYTDVEFRGAAFPIGGDANIDGLVTIPNIIDQFTDQLDGVSHGMGTRDILPEYQFNVAESGAETEQLPEQALELIRRVRHYIGRDLTKRWALITVATGSEEFCDRCEPPDYFSLRKALGALRKGIPKCLVVLLGPVHVASTYKQSYNLMRPRCRCLERMTGREYRRLFSAWKEVFMRVEKEFNSLNYTSFGVLAIPSLTIHSRNPQTLFVPGKPLLNRKGHSYAAKWLWNRLMTGPNYNIAEITLSQDSYYCPSAACPYFRTVQNFERCDILTEERYGRMYSTTGAPQTGKQARKAVMQRNLGSVIFAFVTLSLISVCFFGTIFYCHGMKATKGRFDYGKTTSEPHDDDE